MNTEQEYDLAVDDYELKLELEQEWAAPKYKYSTTLDEIGKADIVFSINDRKNLVIKSRIIEIENGPVESIDDLSKIISKMILSFIHPIYLPTFDEAIEPEIKNKVMNLLKEYNYEMPKM